MSSCWLPSARRQIICSLHFPRVILGLAAAGIAIAVAAGQASAQTISITSPTASRTVQEGNDFATQQLQNPWDFTETRDIGFELGFNINNISNTGGIWKGVSSLAGAYVLPLFGGYPELNQIEGLQGDRKLPRYGSNTPITASKYKLLTFRLRQNNRSTIAIYWDNSSVGGFFPDGANFGAFGDSFAFAGIVANSGLTQYSFDMSTLPFEQKRGSWTGDIYALRLDPSVTAAAGSTTEFDWIRLVDPASGPDFEVCFTVSGSAPNNLITIFEDGNNAGFDGVPVARFTYANGTTNANTCTTNSGALGYKFSSAILPPGNHYFYATLSSRANNTAPLTQVSRSGYSAALVINAAPNAYFTAPTQLTGRDYAISEVGNPWDMDAAADVKNLGAVYPQALRQFTSPAFVNGVFQAIADPPLPGNTESDVQVHMNVPANKPIGSSKYRYLTYKIGIDGTLYPSLSDRIERGWVMRPVWWRNDIVNDGGGLKAHILYEGNQVYTTDLWDTSKMERGTPWTSSSSWFNLRVDPLETPVNTYFFLDYVELHGENVPTSNQYQISFSIDDPDSSAFDVTAFYDADNKNFDGSRIAAVTGIGAGSRTLTWNTAAVKAGRYYVYIVISDGVNTKKIYSPVPIAVGNVSGGTLQKIPYDFDGDRKSDRAVYRPGAFYINNANGTTRTQPFGGAGFVAVSGDFDGDLKTDPALVFQSGGTLTWYIVQSLTNTVRQQAYGLAGDVLAVADYDGDGRDEIAIFRSGAWFILYSDLRSEMRMWGVAGDIPLPRDYDGDGTDDLCVWRPSNGTWYIINSSGTPSTKTRQFGVKGDIPLPADFDGDGLADTALWRPRNGSWYIVKSQTLATESIQFGLPGDVPVVGDFIGDNQLDVSVWRPSNGTWYHNDRKGNISTFQWGLPGDTVGW